MTDIIESLESKEIRPLEVPERTPVYVYCTSYKVMRQLSRLADVAYTSQKGNYTLLYVNENDVQTLLEKLKMLKFVKKVCVGHLKEMNQNFSEAFEKTNAEVRQEIELAEN